MRPETLESFFYLWRLTKDPKWRQEGFAIISAMNKHCRTDIGYSPLQDVTQVPPTKRDKVESWFVAETLKYAYLLMSDASVLNLDNLC